MANYKCPRCGSTETYKSEENGRTFALTLDTPSPVDPTIFHTMKHEIVRCKKCGEKAELDRWNYTVPKHTPEEWLEITESIWRRKGARFRNLIILCWLGTIVFGSLLVSQLLSVLRFFPNFPPISIFMMALFGVNLLMCQIFLRDIYKKIQLARESRNFDKKRYLEEIESRDRYRIALSASENEAGNPDT